MRVCAAGQIAMTTAWARRSAAASPRASGRDAWCSCVVVMCSPSTALPVGLDGGPHHVEERLVHGDDVQRHAVELLERPARRVERAQAGASLVAISPEAGGSLHPVGAVAQLVRAADS